MKRKLISLITVLALCLSLCPTWALAADAPALLSSATVSKTETLKEDLTVAAEFIIEEAEIFDVRQWSYTATKTTAIAVQSTGKLYLRGEGGSVTSAYGIGVKVESGGSLIVDVEYPVAVTGKTYGLDIANGAAVELSGGTFSGDTAAIKTADGDFAALLVDGYAYFDDSGSPMLPKNVAAAKKVTIKQCSDHPGKNYTHDDGAPTHSWVCPYCGAKADAEPCTFSFDANGEAKCAGCGHAIAIAIDTENLGDLIYNSQEQTANVTLTVTLGDGTPLTENTDYEVSYTSRADVGEITVTVTGVTYNGTFTKTYSVSQAQPVIAWAETSKEVDYNGSQVKSTDLPEVNITASDDLSSFIQYSYKKDGDADFTDGLPTNAGAYEIKASLPESQNYKAAETDPCLTLTINKIPAVKEAPKAKTLTYNREPQELVTTGVLEPGAVAEGAVIEFARAQNGPYSTDIPAETSAGNHTVWYRVQVEEAGNYTGTPATQVSGVRIELKTITPTVELSYYTTLYDGGKKEPTVTVKDGEAVVPNTEYEATYSNNQNVGTATVTVKNKNNGNYKITTAAATFKITSKTQDALTITDKPDTVAYGDRFTLGTSGGSGNGAVTWKITAGGNVAEVDANSGQVTIKGVGTATVQATRSGAPNYENATATWQFTAAKKPVTPVVTAADKNYDGSKEAQLTATWKTGDLVGEDTIEVHVTGEFLTEGVGTNKQVKIIVNSSATGTNVEKYIITYPATTTASITPAPASVTVTEKEGLTYTGSPQPLVVPGAVTGGDAAYSLDGVNYSLIVPTGTDAGTYKVWYKALADENYKDSTPATVEVTIGPKNITPEVEASPSSYVYDGSKKTPTITVKDGITVLDSDQYTVDWGNTDWTAIGTHTATITTTGKNYTFTTDVTVEVEIRNAVQGALTITNKPNTVVYGDQFTLGTSGGLGNGAVTWKIITGKDTVATVDENSGQVTIKGVGTATVQATKAGAPNYEDAIATWQFTTAKKPVTPVVTAADKNYDGGKEAQLTATWKTGDLVGEDTIEVHVTGEFLTEGVGRNKQVKIIVNSDAEGNVEKYVITYPATTTASIDKVDAKLAATPTEKTGLVYNGEKQELLDDGGSTENNIGEIEYSLSEKGEYSTDFHIPKATNAGTYTVWYRVADSVNYTGIAPASREVTIGKADTTITEDPAVSGALTYGQPLNELALSGGSGSVPGSFAWTDGSIKPPAGTSEQEVTFTPADAVNYKTSTKLIEVTVTEAPSDDNPGGGSPPNNIIFTQTNPDGSTTTKTEDTRTGAVTETTKKPDGSSVTKVEQKDGATATVATDASGKTEAEVTLSGQAVSEAQEKGGAVVLPIPEVKATKSADTAPVITVNTGSEDEVMVEIPAADVTPGTVAVLVKADGTKEVIKTSVPTENGVAVSLPDGATVKLVDNSKDFADVPAESQEADAVAFASARELFKGTSETTFDPDAPMTRAMMTTVLARLDGVDTTSGATWYEKGQEWAVEKGISNGSNPNGTITREQLAVMLWRYAGCPATDGEALNFTDADQASAYAMEALRWATAKGILDGTGDGLLDPGGTATRAEAAQILKKFIENT